MTAHPGEDPAALVPFGWAPGGYQSRCGQCNAVHYDTDKRSPFCRPCAEKERDAYLAKMGSAV